MIDVNWTYGNNFAKYTSIESLCCTPERNVICQLYPNLLKKIKNCNLSSLNIRANSYIPAT